MTVTLLLGAPAELGLLLRATLLMGTAWAAAAALRRAGASAAARHTAWLLGIAALLALPILWWCMPALQLPLLPPEAAIPASSAPPSVVAVLAPAMAESAATGAPGWRGLLLAAYLLGAFTLLLRLIVARQVLARLWRDSEPARDPSWEDLLSRLSRDIRLARPVELRIATGSVMPMTWGTLAPRIMLPAEASAWAPERRRLVLLHELAHVDRCDSFSRSLASLACALYWFHPGAWFAARRLRMEQEHAADDRVLAAGGSAQAYARSLLHIAREIGDRPQADLAATMAGMCQLERRLVSITGPARRDRPTPAFLSSSALLAALATLIVAVAVPVSASTAGLGTPGADPAGVDAIIADRMDSARTEDSVVGDARTPARPERDSSARASAWDAAGRPAGDDTVGSDRRAPEAGGIAEAEPAQRRGATSRERELESPAAEGSRDGRQASGYTQQLSDYRWELRQPSPTAQLASLTEPLESARLASPTALPASRERTGRPKWARIAPQLVRPGKSTRVLSPTSERTLMLSLSIDVGAP